MAKHHEFDEHESEDPQFGSKTTGFGANHLKLSATNQQIIFDLICARVLIEYLEEDVSTSLHLYHGLLIWTLNSAPAAIQQQIRNTVRAKILQLPQGCPEVKRLIILDQQSGALLESAGVYLKRWGYEPREKSRW